MMISRLLLAMLLTGLSVAGKAEDRPKLETEKDKISYSIGYQVGGDFRRQQLEARPEVILQGIQDAMSGGQPHMTQTEMRATLSALGQRVAAERQQQQSRQSSETLEKGKAFMQENAGKEGVKTTASGLQYKVIKQGAGITPGKNDRVTVHYRGSLIDGTEFDSSYSRNKPATFGVSQVISGWTEALMMMQEGSEWQLFIPAELAYGERRVGRITPNSTLIFDVLLISVTAAEAGGTGEEGKAGK